MFTRKESSNVDNKPLNLAHYSTSELEAMSLKLRTQRIPGFEEALHTFITKTQESLVSIEKQYPVLQGFGSYTDRQRVIAMLEASGSNVLDEKMKEINELFKKLDPNYKPPKQTESQKELQAINESAGKAYLAMKKQLEEARQLVMTIQSILKERKLSPSKEEDSLQQSLSIPKSKESSNTFFSSNSLNNLLAQYKLPDTTQGSLEKGLRMAAANGRVEDLKLLLLFVEDVEAKDSNPLSQKTALDWAMQKRQEGGPRQAVFKKCCELLMDAIEKKASLSQSIDKP